MSDKINILLCMNSGLFRQSFVLLNSIFSHEKPEKIHIHLFETDFSDKEKEEFQDFINHKGSNTSIYHINKDMLSGFNANGRITIEAYLRLLAVDVLPLDLDRILYLDVDMIVNHSIRSLYIRDFEDCYLAACRIHVPLRNFLSGRSQEVIDVYKNLEDINGYFNSGMLLFNLSKMRNDGYNFLFFRNKTKELCSRLKKSRAFQEDQGILNYIFAGEKTKYLEEWKYNIRPANYDDYPDCEGIGSIIHFTNEFGIKKPWFYKFDNAKYYTLFSNNINERIHQCHELWWDYAKETPYYESLLHEASIRTKEYTSVYPKLVNEKKMTFEHEKFKSYSFYYSKLIKVIHENHDSILDVLLENNWLNVAFYGKTLVSDDMRFILKNTCVNVSYIIENNLLKESIPVYRRDEKNLPECSVIIITDLAHSDTIKTKLKSRVCFPVIDANDIVNHILYKKNLL